MEDNDRKGSDRRRQKQNTDMTAEPLQAVLNEEATPYQDLDDRQINVDLVNTTAVPVLAKLAEPLERTQGVTEKDQKSVEDEEEVKALPTESTVKLPLRDQSSSDTKLTI